MNKYNNKKVEIDGIKFDSQKEAARYCELKLLEKARAISDLQMQVKYVLIPAQRAFTSEIGKDGRFKKGKLLERECAYYADFVYVDCSTGHVVVEDVKGARTEVYKIKRKLMLDKYGIMISEI